MPGVLFCCLMHHARRGDPQLGSVSVDRPIRHLKENSGWVLLCCLVGQALNGPASLVQLPVTVCGEREAMVMTPPLMDNSQHCLASITSLFSSTDISHHNVFLMTPWSISVQLTEALTLGLLHNPYTPGFSCCAF